MADLDRELFALLDRAAEGGVGPAPVHDIVRRGRLRRRHRRQALAIGVATAGVLVAGISAGVVLGGDGNGRAAPVLHSPVPTSSFSPHPAAAPTGATAQQIAHGTWVNLPAAPMPLCPGAASAWTGRELLVVSDEDDCSIRPGHSGTGHTGTGVAAAAYDPATQQWRRLPPPPSAVNETLTAVWTGDTLIVATPQTGAAAVYNSHADGWGVLPSLPKSPAASLSLVWDGFRVVAVGVGPAEDGTYALDGDHWSALQPLPHHDGEDVAAVGAGVVNGDIFAVEATETVTPLGHGETDHAAAARLLWLDGLRWEQLPHPPDLPYTTDRIEAYGKRLFVAGSLCPPNSPCPLAPPQLMTFEPGSTIASGLGVSPLDVMARDSVVAGRAILTYNEGGTESGPRVRPGDTAVYDVSTGRWLRAPSSVAVDDIAATAWTPYGFAVLGNPVEKCLCKLGGVILRPATRHP